MTSATNTVESTVTTDATTGIEEVKAKATGKGKGKTPRLKLVKKGFRPGVQVPANGSAVADVYNIVFSIPLSTAFGTADEISLIRQFAVDLDALARTEKVGVVGKIGIVEGTAEVMLKLALPDDFPAEPADQIKDEIKDDLATEAFTKVHPVVKDAAVLKVGNVRNRPTWIFKVNNSPLDDGLF
jgi:hypothetical protein